MTNETPGYAELAKFYAAAIEHMVDGWDWDSLEMQEAAEMAGLTFQRKYNAATDSGMDADEGDLVWVQTEIGKAALAKARGETA